MLNVKSTSVIGERPIKVCGFCMFNVIYIYRMGYEVGYQPKYQAGYKPEGRVRSAPRKLIPSLISGLILD